MKKPWTIAGVGAALGLGLLATSAIIEELHVQRLRNYDPCKETTEPVLSEAERRYADVAETYLTNTRGWSRKDYCITGINNYGFTEDSFRPGEKPATTDVYVGTLTARVMIRGSKHGPQELNPGHHPNNFTIEIDPVALKVIGEWRDQ